MVLDFRISCALDLLVTMGPVTLREYLKKQTINIHFIPGKHNIRPAESHKSQNFLLSACLFDKNTL